MTEALTVLRGGSVFAPAAAGLGDVVIAAGRVLAITEPGAVEARPAGLDVVEVDCSGRSVLPGLVDGHLHVLGGGGGAGYGSRIPELPSDAVFENGVTTAVAMPGVDPVTKNLEAMLAKAYGWRDGNGPRTLVMSGGFRWPHQSLTGDLVRDLYLLPDVVGVKIAMFESKATAPMHDELVRLLCELHWCAEATGKAGLLHVHLGRAGGDRSAVARAVDEAGTPPDRVQLTHVNYCRQNLDAAAEFGRAGCLTDVNPLINPARIAGSVAPAEAVAALLERGVPHRRITVSSDGNASVPSVGADGVREPFARHLALLPTIHELTSRGILAFPEALALVTAHPADALRLADAGRLAPGCQADVVVTDAAGRIGSVLRAGVEVVRDGRAVEPWVFRDPRWQP